MPEHRSTVRVVPAYVRQEAAVRRANGDKAVVIAQAQAGRDVTGSRLEALSGPQTPDQRSIYNGDVAGADDSRLPRLRR